MAQELQQKRHEQIDKFQEIDGQLVVKAIAMLQAIQENRKPVEIKASEEHPIQQTLTNCQSIASKFQL